MRLVSWRSLISRELCASSEQIICNGQLFAPNSFRFLSSPSLLVSSFTSGLFESTCLLPRLNLSLRPPAYVHESTIASPDHDCGGSRAISPSNLRVTLAMLSRRALLARMRKLNTAPERHRQHQSRVYAPLRPHSISLSNTNMNLQRTRGHKRRKAKSLARRFRSLALRHTWLLPLILMLVILGLYAMNPTSSNPIHSMIFLSYALPHNDPLAAKQYERTTYWSQTTQYGKGGRDFAFVGFYMIVLSFTREFIMQRFIRPWAIWCGIRGKAKQARFMEQAYTAVYFLVFGPYGLYVMKRSPIWYFDTTAMFVDFPHRTHEGLFKAYYLLQAAYWAQQALVLMLQLEKPRKDFKELVAHHIVTIALIWLSYRFHFTYMGLAVYITHDVSDFFLAVSISNYSCTRDTFMAWYVEPKLTTYRQASSSTTLTHPLQVPISLSLPVSGLTAGTT